MLAKSIHPLAQIGNMSRLWVGNQWANKVIFESFYPLLAKFCTEPMCAKSIHPLEQIGNVSRQSVGKKSYLQKFLSRPHKIWHKAYVDNEYK